MSGVLQLNLGSSPNDGTGDKLRTGGQKINTQLYDLYQRMAGVEAFEGVPGAFMSTIPGAVGWSFNGSFYPLLAGQAEPFFMPFKAKINAVLVASDQPGNAVLDIWACSLANYDGGLTHPVVGDSICGGNKPALSSAAKYVDTSLTNWTTTFNQGDVLVPTLVSVSTIIRLTMTFLLTRIFP